MEASVHPEVLSEEMRDGSVAEFALKHPNRPAGVNDEYSSWEKCG